jgi:hypothetical protein
LQRPASAPVMPKARTKIRDSQTAIFLPLRIKGI